MKYFFIVLLLLFISPHAFAFDQELECRKMVQFSTERAQWGIDMRKEMLKVCKGKNFDSCLKPYTEKISDQKTADDQLARTYFDSHDVSQASRTMVLTTNMFASTAALTGLKWDSKSADQIANDLYLKCLRMGR